MNFMQVKKPANLLIQFIVKQNEFHEHMSMSQFVWYNTELH